jgi:hypothetical protein
MRSRIWNAVLLLAVLLVACAPQGQQVDTPAPTSPPPGSGGGESDGYAGLLDALSDEGVRADSAGEIEQPFFSVIGQSIEIGDALVQVFEYADEAARGAESALISPDGSSVGSSMMTWVDRPSFWAQGRLIVLYVGSDQAIVDLLTGILGQPVTQAATPPSAELPPYAVIAAEQMLSQELGLSMEEIDYVSHERADWLDSCLGLGGPEEICLQAITPGWRVVLRAAGQEYVYRADQNGDVIRLEGTSEASVADEPLVLAQGEFIGVGGHGATGMASVVQLPDGSFALRLKDFAVTDGPDLYVYLVSSASPASSADFGEYLDLGLLESMAGDQEYAIPAGVAVDQFQGAVIHCLEYDVLFATSALNSGGN